MNPNEVIEALKKSNPNIIGKLSDSKISAIIRSTLMIVAKQVTEAEEGTVRVPGLGVFKVRNVEREIEGEKKEGKRILFVPAKEREKKERPERSEGPSRKGRAAKTEVEED